MPKHNIGLTIALLLLLLGCGESTAFDPKHVIRTLESPNGAVTASITRNASGGAAGSLSYAVYLSGAHSERKPERIFDAANDCDPTLEWRDNSLLAITYSNRNCSIYGFRNFWYERPMTSEDDPATPVEIMLVRVDPSSNGAAVRQ